MNTKDDILRLEQELKACRKALVAIGDETRQHILMTMFEGECGGNRVIDITERTNLSRPAVSHHMQILKDAGFVKVRKEGTKYYYYLDMDDNEIDKLCMLFEDIRKILKNVPDRSEKDNWQEDEKVE